MSATAVFSKGHLTENGDLVVDFTVFSDGIVERVGNSYPQPQGHNRLGCITENNGEGFATGEPIYQFGEGWVCETHLTTEL